MPGTARKGLIYGVGAISVAILITLFDLYNQWLYVNYPSFPIWVVPLASAIVIVGGSRVIWHKIREGELMKYEFMTTVTHKFRTPLTHIKWATENLRKSETADDWNEQIGYVEGANAKLVELTDLLANASETDTDLYQYRLNRHDLSSFVNEIIMSSVAHASFKNIKIDNRVPVGTYALFDVARLKFVLQTLIENGINYTKEGGSITITVADRGKQVMCSIKDTGIGIPKNELSLMFTKLYRGKVARLADTEGMGIGLFISRGIITRHHGKMWVESEGENKGSTFSFSLPKA
ncbi:MAG: HAMP domain-containing sensor histidine kinase [Candidatus Paceibacterota bacterium]